MFRISKSRRLVLAVVLAAFGWLWRNVHQLDSASLFIAVMVFGLVGGIAIAEIVLPWIGDVIATFFYSSVDMGGDSRSDAATAKVAQGDFAGAILEYERNLVKDPADLFAISEICKIKAGRLDDVDGAIRWLRDKLAERSWNREQQAFLRFRLVDLLARSSVPEAERELGAMMVDFHGTRHGSNARYQLGRLRKRGVPDG